MDYRILQTKENAFVRFDVFLETLKDKDIIYIGEFHQVPEILSFQMGVISGLMYQGIRPSIGLEMFNVLQQTMLDYYIAGAIPFEQLSNLYAAGPEGFDLNHYMHLIEIAVKNNLKAIGLNIPKSIASAVAKQGLDKRELECFHLDEKELKNCNKEYKKSLSNIYKKHPHDEITEENFILAQSIKDEMMAETIAHYLTTENIETPLIVIAGRGHIEYGYGIPERVKEKMVKKGRGLSDTRIVAVYEDEMLNQGMADYAFLIKENFE